MSAIPSYPDYKNSGAEWLGRIPAGWDMLPMFTVARESKLSNKGMMEDNLLSLSYGRIIRKSIDTLGGLLPESFETYQVVNENDQVFRLTDLQNDKRSLRTAMCTERGIITSAYVAVTPFKIYPGYFSYLMRAYDENKVFYNLGSGMRQSLKYDELKRLPVVVPPGKVQQQIVVFLDLETARIDKLIAEKQNFINLLKEKRQALISHIVTKGLNHKVKMKDSKIEWIGEVPGHWVVTPLKHVITLIESGTSVNAADIPADECKIGVLKTSCVYGGEFRWEENKTVIEEELSRVSCRLRKDALIVSRMNTPDLVGSVGFVNEAPSNIHLPDRLWQIKINDSAPPKFMHLWMQTPTYRAQVKMACAGTSSSMQNLSQDEFKNFVVALPPLSEQVDILSEIEKKVPLINKLVSETELSIKLLREHRTALISAAVTGKIDVRNQV